MTDEKVKIVSGPKSWIEGEAIAQLERTARYPDMDGVFGMPDLHPGPGTAVGACYVTHNRIYPHLVGSDIGCGMMFWKTSIRTGKPEKLAKKLKGLERGIAEPLALLEKHGVEPCGHEHSLGTIGRGNHFAEILVPDGIIDPDRYSVITGDAESLLLVHSGSRNFGETILYKHTAQYHDAGLPLGDELDTYLAQHNHALAWARVNRIAIGERILDLLDAEGSILQDVPHNFVEGVVSGMTVIGPTLEAYRANPNFKTTITANISWYHRKGAIPSNRGPVVIPGSRNAHSYLVEPIGNDAATGYSLSHGAGRKMSRKDARVKFNAERDSIKRLQRTKFGSVVICEDRELLMEEAGEAYKPIDRVIQDLVDHDLIRVIAMLKPRLTYKLSREHDGEC